MGAGPSGDARDLPMRPFGQRQTPPLPTAEFADVADALFVGMQVMAIRIDTMRSLLGEGVGQGYLENRIDEAVAQGTELGALFKLFFALIPHEATVRRLLEAVLRGDYRDRYTDRDASVGPVNDPWPARRPFGRAPLTETK